MRETVENHKRALVACRHLSVWWDNARAVIQNGDAAHELAGIVMIARAAMGLRGSSQEGKVDHGRK